MSKSTVSLAAVISLMALSFNVFAADNPAAFLQQLSADAVAASNQRLLEIENYREQIGQIESTAGVFDQSLLEPLSALVELYTAEQDFEEVDQLLQRKLQVIRTVNGFEDATVIPVLEEIIGNELRREEWAAISDELEHIQHVVMRGDDVELRLQAMQRQVDWYLARVYLDQRSQRSKNFLTARRLIEDMLDIAEEEYGEVSQSIVAALYQQAVGEYQLVSILNAGGGLGSDTIDTLIRSNQDNGRLRVQGSRYQDFNSVFGQGHFIAITENGTDVGEPYLRDGLHNLARIKKLFDEIEDAEAHAMAMIYHADFQVLMGLGTARRQYRQARDKLLRAGLAQERIDLFFSQPVILPMDRFFTTLDDAIAHQNELKSKAASLAAETEIIKGRYSLGEFTGWNYSVAHLKIPDWPSGLDPLNLNFGVVDIRLNITSRGESSAVSVLQSSSDSHQLQRDVRDSVKRMRFRPVMIDGKGQRLNDIHLRVRVVPKA